MFSRWRYPADICNKTKCEYSAPKIFQPFPRQMQIRTPLRLTKKSARNPKAIPNTIDRFLNSKKDPNVPYSPKRPFKRRTGSPDRERGYSRAYPQVDPNIYDLLPFESLRPSVRMDARLANKTGRGRNTVQVKYRELLNFCDKTYADHIAKGQAFSKSLSPRFPCTKILHQSETSPQSLSPKSPHPAVDFFALLSTVRHPQVTTEPVPRLKFSKGNSMASKDQASVKDHKGLQNCHLYDNEMRTPNFGFTFWNAGDSDQTPRLLHNRLIEVCVSKT